MSSHLGCLLFPLKQKYTQAINVRPWNAGFCVCRNTCLLLYVDIPKKVVAAIFKLNDFEALVSPEFI